MLTVQCKIIEVVIVRVTVKVTETISMGIGLKDGLV